MNFLRAFIAGLVFPSVVLPIGLAIAVSNGNTALLNVLFIHIVPLIWGVWNVLYFAIFKAFIPGGNFLKLFINGAILGFLIAFYAVFWLGLPSIIDLPNYLHYLPLLAAPTAYGLVWSVIVNALNRLVGVKD